MDLALETISIGPGRKAKPVAAVTVRELEPKDLATLSEERELKPTAIKRLGDRHHSLARLLAGGTTMMAAAAITGYNISRISILKGDPTFQELVEFYRGQQDEIYFDMHQQLAGLSADALQELRDRLEDKPEEFSSSMLLEIMTKTADRSGHGPSSEQKVNVNFGIADRLEKARKRHKEKVLELRAEPVDVDVEV